jgi:hypothetical protein
MVLWTAPLALLAACSLKVGKNQSDANMASVKVAEDGNVAITANDGSTGVSVSVPGFDARVKVPGMHIGGEHMDIDGMKLYPGTKLDGINVTDQKGPGNGQVDMRFTSPGTPDKIAAYYAAAARNEDFSNINVSSQGGRATLTARKKDGDDLTISMEPATGGSTTGRILIKDAKE